MRIRIGLGYINFVPFCIVNSTLTNYPRWWSWGAKWGLPLPDSCHPCSPRTSCPPGTSCHPCSPRTRGSRSKRITACHGGWFYIKSMSSHSHQELIFINWGLDPRRRLGLGERGAGCYKPWFLHGQGFNTADILSIQSNFKKWGLHSKKKITRLFGHFAKNSGSCARGNKLPSGSSWLHCSWGGGLGQPGTEGPGCANLWWIVRQKICLIFEPRIWLSSGSKTTSGLLEVTLSR